jgi:hypothetical protein
MAVSSMLFASFQLHHMGFLGVTPVSGNPTAVFAHQQLVPIKVFAAPTFSCHWLLDQLTCFSAVDFLHQHVHITMEGSMKGQE